MKNTYHFYMRIPWLGAIYLQAGAKLYKKHLYSVNKWNKETIVDFPFGHIIFTP